MHYFNIQKSLLIKLMQGGGRKIEMTETGNDISKEITSILIYPGHKYTSV